MTEPGGRPIESETGTEKVPRGQWFFDNIFLLLALSLLISGLLYNVWGILELVLLPILPLT